MRFCTKWQSSEHFKERSFPNVINIKSTEFPITDKISPYPFTIRCGGKYNVERRENYNSFTSWLDVHVGKLYGNSFHGNNIYIHVYLFIGRCSFISGTFGCVIYFMGTGPTYVLSSLVSCNVSWSLEGKN